MRSVIEKTFFFFPSIQCTITTDQVLARGITDLANNHVNPHSLVRQREVKPLLAFLSCNIRATRIYFSVMLGLRYSSSMRDDSLCDTSNKNGDHTRKEELRGNGETEGVAIKLCNRFHFERNDDRLPIRTTTT